MRAKNSTKEVAVSSLVGSQQRLVAATAEYVKAKDYYAGAADRLNKAEEEHQAALLAFNQEVMTVKEAAVVKPNGL